MSGGCQEDGGQINKVLRKVSYLRQVRKVSDQTADFTLY